MRILYFSRDYTPHDYRYLAALANTSHEVFYLRLEDGGQVMEDRSLPPEIEQVQWSGGRQPARITDINHLVSDLRRVIRQVKPDLVHAGPIQRAAFLVALTGFHPLVTMSWGYDLLRDAQINRYWRWATRFTLQRSDALVGDCDTIRQLAISFGVPTERIVTFPWGIDLTLFNVQARKRSGVATFNLLSTRNWEPIYGVDVIARAFVIAARKRPDLRLTLLSTGSQLTMIRQILLVGAAYEKVIFPGPISYTDLPSYYQNTDIYIGASHSDGTSISLLEAFACGKAAIVPDIPGNREWIVHGENGWLYPDGSSESLASAILNAVEQRPSLPEMGRQARSIAEARADWNMNFPKLENAYAIALEHSATHAGAG